ncbi:MAG: hypothetical protein K940chlam1_00162 [Candidatus Anoxychlamydiales bacterium]|nr:hypothetical protein [Candidatus Anoxychlamydiales bacterium]NGX36110.1 hypothetical protein [Candidatus Anoxychlamydiales bacterium]
MAASSSSISHSPARVIHSRLTDDQYNKPATFSPGINFPTNDQGHPYSMITHEEITPGTPISLQQCSCKLAEQTNQLVQWTIRGNSICMQCKDPLDRSDLITRTRKVSRFIMKSLVVSAALLPLISIIYSNDNFDKTLSCYVIGMIGISIWLKTNYIFLDIDILPKIARLFIKHIPPGIAAIYIGSYLIEGFCCSKWKIIEIIGKTTSWLGSMLTFRVVKHIIKDQMN